MKTPTTLRKITTLLACCLGLGLMAGGLALGLSPDARASSVAHLSDPRVGDYEAAQAELEAHLDQRLRLHLARAARLTRAR